MGVKYTKLSEYEELKETSLQVCNSESEHFSVLQYKAQGILLYSHERGMYSENVEEQKGQVEAFLKLARKKGVDLAISPEASVPWEIAEKILEGNLKPPRKGKLWFLGMEGISLDDFEETLDEWKKKDDIVIINSQMGNLSKHINAAIYFFITEADKLAVIIQAKIGGMKDVSFEHEQNDLSAGSEIFLLDLNGTETAQNVIGGMICADIFHINRTDFCRNFHGKTPLILHIQMNPKPYYKEMASFRDTFFRDSEIRGSQVITANWGRYTSIIQEGSPADEKRKGYADSGSTVYMDLRLNHGTYDFHDILKDRFIKHMGEVQQSGFEYFLTEKYEIWKLQEAIDVVIYRMKKGFCLTGPGITMRQQMPFVVERYRYDEKDDLMASSEKDCDCTEMQEVFEIFDNKCEDMGLCADKRCTECRRFYVDSLISLCLGEEVYEEYRAPGEKSQRAVQTLYQDCKDANKKLLLKELVEEVLKGCLPERFGDFNQKNSFVFAINDDCARNGSNYRYNLSLKSKGHSIRRLLVAYIGHTDLATVRKRFSDLQRSIHEDMQDKVLLYYSDSRGIRAYDEPYIEESILKDNSDYSKDIESFT